MSPPERAGELGRRFGRLLDSMPDATLLIDLDGRIALANRQAEKLFSYAAGELAGVPVESLLPERFRATHVGHRDRYFAHPRTRPMGAGLELFGRRKGGTEFPVEISLSPLETEGGTHVVSAIRDVSERKAIARALAEKNTELEKAAQAKNRFLATMSHELRTPLNAIIGFTGTLLMKLAGPLNPEQEKQLETIRTSGRHLLSLINDLLDLTKIESGKVSLTLEPTPVGEVVEEVAEALRPSAQKKALELSVELPAEGATFETDRRALSQILLNLTNNAIKFTESGGVAIAVESRRVGRRSILEVHVRDTGIGIRPEDQSRLFQAFAQLDSSAGRRFEGTGLGLHLSQRLAGLLGGRITLESEHGIGSVFTLRLEREA